MSDRGGGNVRMGASKDSHLTLGVNTCFAVKRWPEPGRWVSIVVDQLGLSDCQVTLDLFDPTLDPAAVRSYAEDVRTETLAAGLRVHSTFTGLAAYSGNMLLHPDEQARQAAAAWLRRAIDVTAIIGARGTGGYLGAFSVADARDPGRRALLLSSMGRALGGLSEYATEQGLEFLLFENMAVEREFGHDIEEALDLEGLAAQPGTRTPWVLCLDLGHPCALRTAGPSDDPLQWIRTLWSHAPVYQIQQANRQGDHHWPFTPEFNTAGLLDAEEVTRALRQRSVEGETFLFLEVIHPDECPDEQVISDLGASVAHWREAMGEVETDQGAETEPGAETGRGMGPQSDSEDARVDR